MFIIPLSHITNHCNILASAYLFNTLQFKCKSNICGCLFEPHELARVAVIEGAVAWPGEDFCWLCCVPHDLGKDLFPP